MGLLDAPGLASNEAVRLLQAAGWSVISSRSIRTSSLSSGIRSLTSRIEQVPACDVRAVRLVFHNWYVSGTGESPTPNHILVKAAVQKQGATVDEVTTDTAIQATFDGRNMVSIAGGRYVISDPVWIPVAAGERFFVKTYVAAVDLPVPDAPTLINNTTGGSLAAGTYSVSLTYVYPNGMESAGSTPTAFTAAATGKIDIVSPDLSNGAIGWRAYVSFSASSSPQYATDSGVVPIGTNYTLSQQMNSTMVQGTEWVNGGTEPAIPVGTNWGGGTAPGASDNGEGKQNDVERLNPGRSISPSLGTSTYGPIAVLGLTPNRINRSVALIGDSILTSTADYGYFGGPAWGGFGIRAALDQASVRAYDKSITPKMGLAWLSTGGESAYLFHDVGGLRRSQIADLCTSVLCNYGVNDVAGTAHAAAVVMDDLLTIANRFTSQAKRFVQTTITPMTDSTDGWQTVANQTIASAVKEGHRRQLNAWLLKTQGQTTVTDEAMLGAYAGSVTPSTNLYAGGNGTATTFLTRQPFVQGTETVKVANVTKTLTTDYTYVGATTIGGIAYASGVTFTAAPANAAAVTATYTAAAGFTSLAGNRSRITDVAAAIEVDASGVAGTNGGWWKPGNGTTQLTSTTTGSNTTTTLNDTSKSWSQDQWRGYSILITADASTPAAVGQVRGIEANTATQLSIGTTWATTPSNGATYIVFDGVTQDGIHPTTKGHMLMAQAIDTDLFT